MIGTGLVNKRNKAIPGFDTMDKSAEGDVFGTDTDQVVHFSKSVAQILSDNYEELSALKGFDQEAVDDYIEQVFNSDESALIEEQTNLLNATEILLANNGLNAASFAHYWRDRSGTADQPHFLLCWLQYTSDTHHKYYLEISDCIFCIQSARVVFFNSCSAFSSIPRNTSESTGRICRPTMHLSLGFWWRSNT